MTTTYVTDDHDLHPLPFIPPSPSLSWDFSTPEYGCLNAIDSEPIDLRVVLFVGFYPYTSFTPGFPHNQDNQCNAFISSKLSRSNPEIHHNPPSSPFLLPHSNSKAHHNRYSLQLKPSWTITDSSIIQTKFHLHSTSNQKKPTVQSFYPLFYAPAFLSWFSMMRFIDIFSLILSLLGLYGIVFSLKLLLPRNVVPLVSTSLNEAIALLENAEATNTPNVSDYRVDLAIHHNRFLQMRTESHRSPGFSQQVCLLFLCGLTWRLRTLKSEIEDIKRKIELAVDERQLASLTNVQSVTTTALPAPAADTAIHTIHVVELARPPQASIPNAS